jgi:hypothetical protein
MISTNSNIPAFKGIYTVREEHADGTRALLKGVQKEADFPNKHKVTFICDDNEDQLNSANLLKAKIPSLFLETDEGYWLNKPEKKYMRQFIPVELWQGLGLSEKGELSFKGEFRVLKEDTDRAREKLKGVKSEESKPDLMITKFYCRGRNDCQQYDFENRKRLFEAGIPCAYTSDAAISKKAKARRDAEAIEKIRQQGQQKRPESQDKPESLT